MKWDNVCKFFGTYFAHSNCLRKGSCGCGCGSYWNLAAVVASLQDGSQSSLPSGIHARVQFPPTQNGLCNQWILWRWRWVTSKAGSQWLKQLLPCVLDPWLWGSQPPRDEDTQAAPWRGPHEEEPSFLPTWQPLEGTILEWFKPLAFRWEQPSWDILEPPSHSQIPDPGKPAEIINVYCCFKPLTFKVIHYVAIDD